MNHCIESFKIEFTSSLATSVLFWRFEAYLRLGQVEICQSQAYMIPLIRCQTQLCYVECSRGGQANYKSYLHFGSSYCFHNIIKWMQFIAQISGLQGKSREIVSPFWTINQLQKDVWVDRTRKLFFQLFLYCPPPPPCPFTFFFKLFFPWSFSFSHTNQPSSLDPQEGKPSQLL